MNETRVLSTKIEELPAETTAESSDVASAWEARREASQQDSVSLCEWSLWGLLLTLAAACLYQWLR
ncbi:MAG: hypothetical protein IT210_02705 [Armatimonadetes bacterium]|nr:hypothetical protein [Armatimonadota bacterium]